LPRRPRAKIKTEFGFTKTNRFPLALTQHTKMDELDALLGDLGKGTDKNSPCFIFFPHSHPVLEFIIHQSSSPLLPMCSSFNYFVIVVIITTNNTPGKWD
jgi:hypothetical protein